MTPSVTFISSNAPQTGEYSLVPAGSLRRMSAMLISSIFIVSIVSRRVVF
jgi:hypothetical protein